METCSFSLRVGLPLYKRRLPGVSVRIFIGVMRPLWYADKADRDLGTRERFQQELTSTTVLWMLRMTPLTQAVSPFLRGGSSKSRQTSATTPGTHLGVGSVGDTARCMVMGLVKYTRYPAETGHSIKIPRQGADCPGWCQGAGGPSISLCYQPKSTSSKPIKEHVLLS